MTARSAELVLRSIFEKAMVGVSHPRTLASATLLWKALQEMHQEGKTEYSIAEVGRYSERAGGPKAQSIRNKSGALFRGLIADFASATGNQTAKIKRGPLDNIDRALEDVQDLGARTMIRMLIERGRRLERENDMLRSSFKEMSIAPVNEIVPQSERRDVVTASILLSVLPIKRFLSSEWMAGRFWRVEEDGSITDEVIEGQVIAPPGFVDALEELMSARGQSN